MSKGLGHVGRAILAAFEDEPDNAFTTEELCERAYPTTAQHLPRGRARRCVARREELGGPPPDLGIQAWSESIGSRRAMRLLSTVRVLSYAMARLKTDDNWPGYIIRRQNYALNSCPAVVTTSARNQVDRGRATPRWRSQHATAITRSSQLLEAEQERAVDEVAERAQAALAKVRP